ncbi:MAG TPA: hypothetical protein EYH25_04090 [Thermotoga sp.]|nr:hypothetical protein [Thermotoga sp.]
MAELIRQIEILDKAVFHWKKVEDELKMIPQEMVKETRELLSEAMDRYKSLEEDRIKKEIDEYRKYATLKVEEEKKKIKEKILATYEEKRSYLITELIHKLHGGI